MLVHARHLVDRLRQPRSRADELLDVRRRLGAAARKPTGPRARELAETLRELRIAASAAQGCVHACAGCGRGKPLPAGRFDGGHCCSGATADIFTDDEVAALALAGTRPAALRPPDGDHAGCAFRGSTGCSLAPADRPTVCVRYICRDLTAEVAARGDIAHVVSHLDRLDDTWAEFAAVRRGASE